jgi:hypothetical protein
MNLYFKHHNTKILIISCLCFVFSNTVFSQETEGIGAEVVNVVKPYTPTISDAFKIKETPVIADSSLLEKKQVTYSIFSVPVASTFTPAKGKAAKLEKKRPLKVYDNYAALGFGNYTTVLGEFFTNFELSKTDNVGLFFKHHSSQGGIKEILPDDSFYHTALDAQYTSRQKDLSYTFGLGLKHDLINWYGFPIEVPQTFKDKSLSQSYFGSKIAGSIRFEDGVFETAKVSLQYSTDAFASSEFRFKVTPQVHFPVSDFQLRIKGDIDYLSTKFKKNYVDTSSLTYNFLNLGIRPALEYVADDLSVSLGVWGYFLSNLETKNSDLALYPAVLASYNVIDELVTVYGGIEGGVTQNSYTAFYTENPYISPTLNIMPTETVYNGFAGIKGKFTQHIAYNINGSYSKENNKPFYLPNRPSFEISEDYQYGNSFEVVYDDINTLHIFGELKAQATQNMSIGLRANWFNYSLDSQAEAWHLPAIKGSLFSEIKFAEKWFANVSMFYVGKRKTAWVIGDLLPPQVYELDDYLDANLHLGYTHSDRLSFFAKGNNLLNKNYEAFSNFKVQGIQVLLGASYKFDW